MLLSAAQQYDRQMITVPAKTPHHHIYQHEIFQDDYEDGEQYHNSHDSFDIDSNIDTIEAYATFADHGPRLTRDQWYKLPEDARKIWDMLSPDAKSIILQPCPPPDPQKNQQTKEEIQP